MSVISKEISCLNYGYPNDYGSVLLAIFQVYSFMCGKIVIKTEFKIHVWCVHRKRQTAVSSLFLEVRSFVTFSFLDRSRLSPEKKTQHERCHLESHKGWGSFISITKCGEKIGFLVSQTDRLWRKDFNSHIIGHAWELSNRKRKSVRGVQLPETALPEVQTWTANGARDR